MTTTRQAMALDRGDRIPNFVLPNHDGRGMMFYDMACGNPGMLLIDAGASDRDLKAEFDAMRDAAAGIAGCPLEILVLDRRPAAENAALAAGLGDSLASVVPVLSDPGNGVTTAFAQAVFGAAKSPSRFAIVYSANQRILGVLRPDNRPFVVRALEIAGRRNEAVARQPGIAEQAPVLLIPGLLDPEDCADVIGLWRSGNSEGGVAAYRDGKSFEAYDGAKKKRRDRKLDDPALRARVMDRVARRLSAEMFKAFSYENFVLEPPIIGCYDAERRDYFRAHRDNLSPQIASRRFALSLNLNDNYEGGELVFAEYGSRPYRPAAGSGIVFSCAHIHEALPVTKGERFVLLTFLHDPNRTPHPWSMPDQRK